MTLRNRVLPIVLAASLNACATAPPSPTTKAPADATVSRVTELAVLLFGRVCISTAAREQRMRDELNRLGYVQPPPAVASEFLSGQPGNVWVPAQQGVPVVVVTRSSGVLCHVATPFVVVAEANARFRNLFEDLPAGIPVVFLKEVDSPLTPDGRPGNFLIYRATLPATGSSYRFAMSARETAANGVALLMTASRAEPE